MKQGDKIKVVNEACARASKAVRGTISAIVMDTSAFQDTGHPLGIVRGRGRFYAQINVLTDKATGTHIFDVFAAATPKKAIVKAMKYELGDIEDDTRLGAIIKKRLEKFQLHVENYLSQAAIVVGDQVAFGCDLERFH